MIDMTHTIHLLTILINVCSILSSLSWKPTCVTQPYVTACSYVYLDVYLCSWLAHMTDNTVFMSTDRQTDRQTQRQTDRDDTTNTCWDLEIIHRQTDRQTDRQRETDRDYTTAKWDLEIIHIQTHCWSNMKQCLCTYFDIGHLVSSADRQTDRHKYKMRPWSCVHTFVDAGQQVTSADTVGWMSSCSGLVHRLMT